MSIGLGVISDTVAVAVQPFAAIQGKRILTVGIAVTVIIPISIIANTVSVSIKGFVWIDGKGVLGVGDAITVRVFIGTVSDKYTDIIHHQSLGKGGLGIGGAGPVP